MMNIDEDKMDENCKKIINALIEIRGEMNELIKSNDVDKNTNFVCNPFHVIGMCDSIQSSVKDLDVHIRYAKTGKRD